MLTLDGVPRKNKNFIGSLRPGGNPEPVFELIPEPGALAFGILAGFYDRKLHGFVGADFALGLFEKRT